MDSKLEELIQRYTEHYLESYKLSPLQAKIFSYVLIYGRKNDITFDQVIEYTKACKSSVSTSLNCLIQQNKIVFINKPNDRKKYYKVNKLFDLLEQTKNVISRELILIDDMIAYFESTAVNQQDKIQVSNISLFKNYLQQINTTIENTLTKIQ